MTIAARNAALEVCKATTAIDTRPAAYAAACEAAATEMGCEPTDERAHKVAMWAMNKTLGR
jgi:hypothetical protein